jgi:hypothetical protein
MVFMGSCVVHAVRMQVDPQYAKEYSEEQERLSIARAKDQTRKNTPTPVVLTGKSDVTKAIEDMTGANKEPLEIIDGRKGVRGVIDDLGFMTITGRVRNNAAKTYTYVQINFVVLNDAGDEVDTAWTNHTGFAPGAVWRFNAVSLQTAGTRYRLKSLDGY